MTVIEIRTHRWGWKAFEASGVEPPPYERRRNQLRAEPARDSAPGRFVFWIPAGISNAH